MSEQVHTAHVFKAGRGTVPERIIGGMVAGVFSAAYFFPFLQMLSIIPLIYMYPYSVWSYINPLVLMALFILPGYESKAITSSYPFQCMMKYFDFELICAPTAEELASKVCVCVSVCLSAVIAASACTCASLCGSAAVQLPWVLCHSTAVLRILLHLVGCLACFFTSEHDR